MDGNTTAVTSDTAPNRGRRPGSPGARYSLRAAAVLAAWAIAALGAGGCNPKVGYLGSSTEKLDRFLQSDKPVVVDFSKTLCPTCTMVDPVIDKLANEYDGRVTFARFTIMNFFFIVTNWKVHDRYDFHMVPTVVLFVNGQERHRWVWKVDIREYRPVLDEYAGPSTTQRDSAGVPSPVVVEAYRCAITDAKSRRSPDASRGKAVLFDKPTSRIDDSLSLPAGRYEVILTAKAPDSSHNSLTLSVAGVEANSGLAGASARVAFDKEYGKFTQGSAKLQITLPKRTLVKVTVAGTAASKDMIVDKIEFASLR